MKTVKEKDKMYGLEDEDLDEIVEHIFWWLQEGYTEGEIRIGVAKAIKRYRNGINGEESILHEYLEDGNSDNEDGGDNVRR